MEDSWVPFQRKGSRRRSFQRKKRIHSDLWFWFPLSCAVLLPTFFLCYGFLRSKHIFYLFPAFFLSSLHTHPIHAFFFLFPCFLFLRSKQALRGPQTASQHWRHFSLFFFNRSPWRQCIKCKPTSPCKPCKPTAGERWEGGFAKV